MNQFRLTMEEIRKSVPASKIEILTPDFAGVQNAASQIAEMAPDVFSHDVQTPPRMYSQMRPYAKWERSLALLRDVAGFGIITKSSLILGLGETTDEIKDSILTLHKAGVSILVLGQYLQPAKENQEVLEYISPAQFEKYRQMALSLGFASVVAGPFARSSYKAEEAFGETRNAPRTIP
jgi:lipoic acid synthetase